MNFSEPSGALSSLSCAIPEFKSVWIKQRKWLAESKPPSMGLDGIFILNEHSFEQQTKYVGPPGFYALGEAQVHLIYHRQRSASRAELTCNHTLRWHSPTCNTHMHKKVNSSAAGGGYFKYIRISSFFNKHKNRSSKTDVNYAPHARDNTSARILSLPRTLRRNKFHRISRRFA